MSGQDTTTAPKMPPLVPDDAPAAQKKMQPEQSRDAEGDTLAARVANDPVIEDERQHLSAADPPKHM